MLFSSIPFLYYFFPAVCLLYFISPRKLKNTVLLVSSLIFYGWGEPKYLFLMITTILVFYLCGLAIGSAVSQKMKKLWLTLSCVVGLGLLGVFKYADFFVDSFNAVTGLSVPMLRLALPIGISFYTFQSLSYTIDVYRGNVAVQKNPITFGAYVALFPQLIAGPIVRYVDVAAELNERTHSLEDAALGLRRFFVGLAKKILLANQFGQFCSIFRGSDEKSLVFYWLYGAAFMLQIYFDFSGYSDMAIGLGRIFGFHFIENFNYPYLSRSITEFWRRWHMSLGTWFRDYVYIPLGGNRVKKSRWVFNILAVWMLTGLWHGASWNFVLWGLMFALLLLLEKAVKIERLPAALSHLYVLFLVMFSFVLFNAQDLTQAGQDFLGLLGLSGAPLVSPETLYYLRSYGLLFLCGIAGSTPVVRDGFRYLSREKCPRVMAVLEPVLMALALLICTAYLVDGSFNPFLYFRF